MPRVALINGKNRYQNIREVLALIRDEVRQEIKGKARIVIKPNICVKNNWLAVTHPQTVKAVLDFLLQELGIKSEIIIAEGPFDGGLQASLGNYNYSQVLKDYPVKYVDLNQDDFKEFKIEYQPNKFVELKLAKTILNSDFIISVCPPKTHDEVIVTLTLKNVLVGSIVVSKLPPLIGRYTRLAIHKGPRGINKVLFELTKIIKPDLAVIDGLLGMEGNGPTSRDSIEFNLALAGLDCIAVDSIGTYLMGFEPHNVGYLYYCSQAEIGENDLRKIEIVGESEYQKYKKEFQSHFTYQDQLKWK